MAADLGASTTLVSSGVFGGMVANDGPVPVRTLAQAARLMREAGQFAGFGIHIGEPKLDFASLLSRVSQAEDEVRQHSTLRRELHTAGVAVREDVGDVQFIDAHALAAAG